MNQGFTTKTKTIPRFIGGVPDSGGTLKSDIKRKTEKQKFYSIISDRNPNPPLCWDFFSSFFRLPTPVCTAIIYERHTSSAADGSQPSERKN